VGAGGAAEQGERLVHVEVATFGDDTFGLFDDDAAVEGGLELFGEAARWLMARAWRSPTVATSARAWARRMASSSKAPGSVWNRLSAPKMSVRSRIGTAWTEANPAWRASATNRGQRAVAVDRSATADGPAGVEALRAGALVGLRLQHFQQPGLFGGGSDHP
jgi:hypothetical protein